MRAEGGEYRAGWYATRAARLVSSPFVNTNARCGKNDKRVSHAERGRAVLRRCSVILGHGFRLVHRGDDHVTSVSRALAAETHGPDFGDVAGGVVGGEEEGEAGHPLELGVVGLVLELAPRVLGEVPRLGRGASRGVVAVDVAREAVDPAFEPRGRAAVGAAHDHDPANLHVAHEGDVEDELGVAVVAAKGLAVARRAIVPDAEREAGNVR